MGPGNKSGIIKWASKVRRSKRPTLLVQIESRVPRIALALPTVLPGKEQQCESGHVQMVVLRDSTASDTC